MAQDVTFWLAPKIPHIPDPPGPPQTVHFTLTWGHRQVRQNSLLWLLFKIQSSDRSVAQVENDPDIGILRPVLAAALGAPLSNEATERALERSRSLL